MTDRHHPAEAGALEASRALLQAAFNAGDLDTLARLVTDDVIWLAAGQPPWVGRSEVLVRLGGFFERFDYRFELENSRIDSDGLRAVERSNFVSHVTTETGRIGPPHSGSVVLVWVRRPDWRVAAYLDIGGTLFT